MIIIVDTNILFSACITPNNKIAEILFSPLPHIERISCYYAITELSRHQPKIEKLSKLPADKVNILLHSILKQVDFLDESLISFESWKEANRLTAAVDADDIAFVALTLEKDGILWTGDLKLTNHLRSMGFDRIISTAELYDILGII